MIHPRRTLEPRMICLSPGTKREERAYSQAMVRITCRVDLAQNKGRQESNQGQNVDDLNTTLLCGLSLATSRVKIALILLCNVVPLINGIP